MSAEVGTGTGASAVREEVDSSRLREEMGPWVSLEKALSPWMRWRWRWRPRPWLLWVGEMGTTLKLRKGKRRRVIEVRRRMRSVWLVWLVYRLP